MRAPAFEAEHSTYPFPYWIIRDYFDPTWLEAAVQEIPDPNYPGWQRFHNQDERKLAMGDRAGWGHYVTKLLDAMLAPDFTAQLSVLTGINSLLGFTTGGGIHRIEPGGVLNTHVDFNRLDNGLYRRLNCLLYLNKDWTEADGGHLELRRAADDDDPAVQILPSANTMVVFETSERSWHGHPRPLPGPRSRLSLAVYYYTVDPPPHAAEAHSTIFTTREVV